jgi:peptidoglycan/xylan/chitin deacetylase (PgdA/CDA1 family)
MPFEDRRAVALIYHFLRDAGAGRFPLRAHERPGRFASQLEGLARRFPFCRARDLVDPDCPLPGASVLVSFDDGARDVAEFAVPLLRRHGATATFFVCTRPLLEGRLLDVQKIEFLMQALGLDRFRRAFYEELERRCGAEVERGPLDFAGGYRFYRYDDESVRRFKLDLNYQLPYEVVTPVLDAVFAGVFGEGSEREAVRETYMSRDDLRRLVDAGFEIGSHGHAHRVLPRLDFAGQKRELETSIACLREITGEERLTLAYPFGFHDDSTLRAAEELGLRAGFAGGRRLITGRDLRERWTLPRYDVNDCFDRESNQMSEEVFRELEGSPRRATASSASTT